jgi:hypothetical protein
MGRTKKIEEHTMESLEEITLFRFEDLVIKQRKNSSEDTITYTTIIDKTFGGISDSTYAITAMGAQKNWCLYNESNILIDTGAQHGNRTYHWEGILGNGLYTLTTGTVKDTSKHRVPGRGYKVIFRI